MDRALLQDLLILLGGALVWIFYVPALRDGLRTGTMTARFGQRVHRAKNPVSFYVMATLMVAVTLALTVFSIQAILRITARLGGG